MYNIIFIYLILIFIYILLYCNNNNNHNLYLIESNSGTKLLIHNNTNNNNKIELLSLLTDNLFKLKEYLINNVNNYPEYKEYIKQLNINFNKNNTIIYETDPKSDLTSYSINKGEELAFCLVSKKTGELHDINLLMYVGIHEISHVACPEVGHGPLFKKIFRFLLEEAIKLNLYIKVDYNLYPVEYCGMILSTSVI
jgi:hypothetical protein